MRLDKSFWLVTNEQYWGNRSTKIPKKSANTRRYSEKSRTNDT
jgi:hypothetical protein